MRAALARPVSSSVTAWRSTVSCRLAFSIETTDWPARYCEQLLLVVRERTLPSSDREHAQVLGRGRAEQGAHRHRERVRSPTVCGRTPRCAAAARAGPDSARVGRHRRGSATARRSAASHRQAELPSETPQWLARNASLSTGRARPLSASHASTAVRTASATTPGGRGPSRARRRRVGSSRRARRACAGPPRSCPRAGPTCVELAAELGELVVALDRDRGGEVAVREPAGRLEEGAHLAREGAADHDRATAARAAGTPRSARRSAAGSRRSCRTGPRCG